VAILGDSLPLIVDGRVVKWYNNYMDAFTFDKEFFSVKDTLECGQVFRFAPENAGYLLFSGRHACFMRECGKVVEITADDGEYFKEYFDLKRDYNKIYTSAKAFGIPVLEKSAEAGKGVRILIQDREEMLFSFIVSQNNNIPRIKGIIERLCRGIGEERNFMGKTYYTFPTAKDIAKQSVEFYQSIGLGYRAAYFPAVADALLNGFDLLEVAKLPTALLKKELVKLKGVGPKVADCVALFGFNRTDSFPVDTWIEKLYKEDFCGTLTDRNAITEYFLNLFGENAGYYQQYMFHFKRNIEGV